MNKKDLVNLLEEISSEMDNFLGNAALLTAVKEFRDIQGKLDDLLNKITDDGIEDEAE